MEIKITGEIFPQFAEQNNEYVSCRFVNCGQHSTAKVGVRIEIPEFGSLYGELNICSEHAQKLMAKMYPVEPKPTEEGTNCEGNGT